MVKCHNYYYTVEQESMECQEICVSHMVSFFDVGKHGVICHNPNYSIHVVGPLNPPSSIGLQLAILSSFINI